LDTKSQHATSRPPKLLFEPLIYSIINWVVLDDLALIMIISQVYVCGLLWCYVACGGNSLNTFLNGTSSKFNKSLLLSFSIYSPLRTYRWVVPKCRYEIATTDWVIPQKRSDLIYFVVESLNITYQKPVNNWQWVRMWLK
jgi:hypothetical protein